MIKIRAIMKVIKKKTETIIEIKKSGFKIPIIPKIGHKGAIIRKMR